MNKIKACLTFLAVGTICHALTYNISGVVKDSAGSGIEGAVVRLGKANLSTTTAMDRSFTMNGSIGVKYPANNPVFNANYPFMWKDGNLVK